MMTENELLDELRAQIEDRPNTEIRFKLADSDDEPLRLFDVRFDSHDEIIVVELTPY